jgi:hypothetical protein
MNMMIAHPERGSAETTGVSCAAGPIFIRTTELCVDACLEPEAWRGEAGLLQREFAFLGGLALQKLPLKVATGKLFQSL